MNTAVTSMDEVTQQNAALVEEAAAAAESLVEQAESLIDVVSAFKLSGGNPVSNNRRTVNSPMRASSQPAVRQAPKAVAKPSMVKVALKTGTDDGDWEEF